MCHDLKREEMQSGKLITKLLQARRSEMIRKWCLKLHRIILTFIVTKISENVSLTISFSDAN